MILLSDFGPALKNLIDGYPYTPNLYPKA